jgi:hypothetical protein
VDTDNGSRRGTTSLITIHWDPGVPASEIDRITESICERVREQISGITEVAGEVRLDPD